MVISIFSRSFDFHRHVSTLSILHFSYWEWPHSVPQPVEQATRTGCEHAQSWDLMQCYIEARNPTWLMQLSSCVPVRAIEAICLLCKPHTYYALPFAAVRARYSSRPSKLTCTTLWTFAVSNHYKTHSMARRKTYIAAILT